MTTVINGTSTSASAPAVVGDDSNSGVYFPTSDQVAIATNGTLALIANASQNVGVGTSTPTSRLEVTASGANGIVLGVDGSDSASSTRIFGKSSSSTGGMFYYENTGNPIWCVTTGSTVGSSTGSTRLTVSQYGLALGNYDAATSGTGIKFPATQNPSSDANTLDDYEEGTFEVVITGSSSGTATGQSGPGSGGTYIKIGKMVYCQFYFANPTISGTISGDLRLALPFTVASATRFDNGSAGFLSTTREISSGSTSTDIRLQGSGGNAFANFRQYYIGSRTESNNLSQATASINGTTLLWGTFNFVTT